MYFVFDCVDGNIARITEHTSYTGSFLDTAGGILFFTMVYPAVGLQIGGIDIFNWPLLLGMLTSIMFLIGRLISQRAANMLAKEKTASHDDIIYRSNFMAVFKSIPDLLPILYVIVTTFSREILFLQIMFIYHFVSFLYISFQIHKQMLKLDQKHNG